MGPYERYQNDLSRGQIVPDSAQASAVLILQDLHDRLVARQRRSTSLVARLASRLGSAEAPPKPRGIYFWGGVGRGKTYLMDVFHDTLPLAAKQRTHFHRFMQGVHGELKRLKGEKDPLKKVAAAIAERAEVLCFDEFFVADIADAMILAGLLEELFRLGVVLVATSNSEPDSLYHNGLQRSRFLPAIGLLKSHLQVVRVDGGTDYRLRSLRKAELYHFPLDAAAEQMLESNFRRLAPDFAKAVRGEIIEILGRSVPSRCCSDDVVWFDFEQLCGGPRSAFDYIELAKVFHAVLLGKMPRLDDSRDDQARRFINLVDELYDRSVKLIIAANAPVEELYGGRALRGEFARTASRLLEMQSLEYLAKPHKP